ncbi:MAG TPA: peptide chain release factor 3, partial [Alphaproteobacteria bacterium]|nr:peptide chain release factor 3 [Alphaproteobacteria bacterium]
IPVIFEPTQYYTARWVSAEDKSAFEKFLDANKLNMATDYNGDHVFLARNAWHLNKTAEDFPSIKFMKTKEQAV